MTGRLRVDPVACDGVGLCAHLAVDVIGVDSWGYPIVEDRALSGAELRQARAAVRACPRRALVLEPWPPGTGTTTPDRQ